MGRPKGSKNKKVRAKPRSAYETYEYWYDKYTEKYTDEDKKIGKAGWFRPKLTKAEFEDPEKGPYILAKRAKIPNPARAVAMSQEYVDRTFEKRYKELYGKTLGDIRNKADREKIFEDFVAEMQAKGMTYDEGKDEFERYFY